MGMHIMEIGLREREGFGVYTYVNWFDKLFFREGVRGF